MLEANIITAAPAAATTHRLVMGDFCTVPEVAAKTVRPRLHLSSASVEWSTPQGFFDRINAEFGPLELDVCATRENAKCCRFFTQVDDGLAQPWAPARVWMNPPYGKTLRRWMHKAFEESQRGALVVCLVPSRTDTCWWHNYAARGQIGFVKGRLKFGDCQTGAPFSSAVIVFRPYQRPAVRDTPKGGWLTMVATDQQEKNQRQLAA